MQADNNNNNQAPKRISVAMVGSIGAGTSSLKRRFTNDTYSDEWTQRNGMEFAQRLLVVDGEEYQFTVWTFAFDREGKHDYKIYKGRSEFLICYDIRDKQSFFEIKCFLGMIQRYGSENSQIVLVGTKCDQSDKRQISYDEAKAFAQENGLGYIETSAKNNADVDEAFEELGKRVIQARLSKGNHVTILNNISSSSKKALPVKRFETFQLSPLGIFENQIQELVREFNIEAINSINLNELIGGYPRISASDIAFNKKGSTKFNLYNIQKNEFIRVLNTLPIYKSLQNNYNISEKTSFSSKKFSLTFNQKNAEQKSQKLTNKNTSTIPGTDNISALQYPHIQQLLFDGRLILEQIAKIPIVTRVALGEYAIRKLFLNGLFTLQQMFGMTWETHDALLNADIRQLFLDNNLTVTEILSISKQSRLSLENEHVRQLFLEEKLSIEHVMRITKQSRLAFSNNYIRKLFRKNWLNVDQIMEISEEAGLALANRRIQQLLQEGALTVDQVLKISWVAQKSFANDTIWQLYLEKHLSHEDIFKISNAASDAFINNYTRRLFLEGTLEKKQVLKISSDACWAFDRIVIRQLFLDRKLTLEQMLNISWNARVALENNHIRQLFLDENLTVEQVLGINNEVRNSLGNENNRELFLSKKLTIEQLSRITWQTQSDFDNATLRKLILEDKFTAEQILTISDHARRTLKNAHVLQLFNDERITAQQIHEISSQASLALDNNGLRQLYIDGILTLEQILVISYPARAALENTDIQHALRNGRVTVADMLGLANAEESRGVQENAFRIRNGTLTLNQVLGRNPVSANVLRVNPYQAAVFNFGQSAHTASVHKGVSKVIQDLHEKYCKPVDTQDEIQNEINKKANTTFIDKNIKSIEDFAKRFDKEYPEVSQEERNAAKNFIKKMNMLFSSKEGKTKLTIKEILALVWEASHDSEFLKMNKSNLKTDAEKEKISVQRRVEEDFIKTLYNIRRNYKIDEHGHDLGGFDSESCAGGTINDTVYFLQGRCKKIRIDIITIPILMVKVLALVEENLVQRLKKMSTENSSAILSSCVTLTEYFMSIWQEMKTPLAATIHAEFDIHAKVLKNGIDSINSCIDYGKEIDIDTFMLTEFRARVHLYHFVKEKMVSVLQSLPLHEKNDILSSKASCQNYYRQHIWESNREDIESIVQNEFHAHYTEVTAFINQLKRLITNDNASFSKMLDSLPLYLQGYRLDFSKGEFRNIEAELASYATLQKNLSLSTNIIVEDDSLFTAIKKAVEEPLIIMKDTLPCVENVSKEDSLPFQLVEESENSTSQEISEILTTCMALTDELATSFDSKTILKKYSLSIQEFLDKTGTAAGVFLYYSKNQLHAFCFRAGNYLIAFDDGKRVRTLLGVNQDVFESTLYPIASMGKFVILPEKAYEMLPLQKLSQNNGLDTNLILAPSVSLEKIAQEPHKILKVEKEMLQSNPKIPQGENRIIFLNTRVKAMKITDSESSEYKEMGNSINFSFNNPSNG